MSPSSGTELAAQDTYDRCLRSREATHCSPRRIRADFMLVSWPWFSGAIFAKAAIGTFGVPVRVNSTHAFSRKLQFTQVHVHTRARNSTKEIRY